MALVSTKGTRVSLGDDKFSRQRRLDIREAFSLKTKPYCHTLSRQGSPFRGSICLHLDFFGLGPAEVVIIGVAVGLLFGPDRVKQQLKDKGVKGKVLT